MHYGLDHLPITTCIEALMIDCGKTANWDRIFMIYDEMTVWAEMGLIEFAWKIR